MKYISFELSKLWHRKGFWLVMLFAILLSGLNIIYLGMQDEEDLNHPQAYYSLQTLLHKDFNIADSLIEGGSDDYFSSPGKLYFSDYLATRRQVGEENLSFVGELPKSQVFFQELLHAIELDQVELSEADQADLDYISLVTLYSDQKAQSNPDYQPFGGLSDLISGADLLLGIIPILFLSMLTIQIYGEDLESSRKNFLRLLPGQRTYHFLAKYLSANIMALSYLVILLVSVVLTSQISRGVSFGDIFFPYRTAGETMSTQPSFMIIIHYMGLFLFKLNFFIALAILLVVIIQKVQQSAIIWLIGMFFTTVLVQIISPLHASWNPLFFNYRTQLIGNRVLIGIENYQGVTHILYEPLQLSYVLIWTLMILIICLLSHAYFISNRSVHFPTRLQSEGTLWQKFPTIRFERLKLEVLLSNRFVSIVVFILLLFIVTQMSFILQEHRDNEISDKSILGYQQMYDYYEEMIAELEATLEKNTQLSEQSVTNLTYNIESNKQVQEYLLNQVNKIQRRQQAYETGNSLEYYQTYREDILEYYNPDNHYQYESYRLQPKFDYYHSGDFPTYYGFQIAMDHLNALINRSIRPLLGSKTVYQHYDRPRSLGHQISDNIYFQMQDYSVLGLYHQLIHVYRGDLLIILLILLFCGGSVALEDRNQLTWLFTLPQSRQKIMTDKYLASIYRGLLIFGTILLMVTILGALIDGFGQWNLPVVYFSQSVPDPNLIEDFSDTYHFIALGEIVSKSLILMTVVLSFVLVLMNFISFFARKVITSFFITVMVLGLGYSLIFIPQFSTWIEYLPFIYLDITHVVDGSLIQFSELNSINWWKGILALVIWAGILIVTSYYINRKNRVR